MLPTGENIVTVTDQRYAIESHLGSGGHADVYEVHGRNNRRAACKLYYDEFHTQDARIRLKRLLALRKEFPCPTFIWPTDLVDVSGRLGYVMPIAPGQRLEELIIQGTLNLLEALQVGVALAHSLTLLHGRNISHGDVHSNNIYVCRKGNSCQVTLIDPDNFTEPGIPPALFLGHHLYMAPEIRERHVQPSPATDCFGLTVVLHELIMLRHLVPSDASEAEFYTCMTKGEWLSDPGRNAANLSVSAGYPPQILDNHLARLFRAGVSSDAAKRPSAATWRDALFEAMFRIFVCPQCGGPNLIDASKTTCPSCQESYPTLAIEGYFGRIILNRATVVLGRANLGGSNRVSARHSVIRRIGPEYRIEDCSANGTARKTKSGWVQLPRTEELAKQPIIRAGDRLRLADVECIVCEV